MYRRNTSGQTLGFKLVNVLTGASLTGATVSVYRSIDGGAQVAASGTVAEKGNGQYVFSPSAADLNGNQVSFLFLATGAIPEEKTVVTTAADPTDAQRLGLTALPASGTLAIKPAVTLNAADVSGNLPANIVQVAGQTANASGAVTFPSAIGTSTYAGADTSGTTTLLGRVTASVALAGVAPSWYSAPVAPPTSAAIASAVWDELKSSHAVVGSFGAYLDIAVSSRSAPATAQKIDLTQTLSAARDLSAVADTSLTVNDALHCATAATAGRESISGTTYQTKTSAGTLLRQFTLDSATAPTSRT